MSMTWTEYQDQVKADALEVIESEYTDYSDWDEMNDALFIDDSVTGNGSGSYTFNTAKAAENVAGIIFDPEAVDAFKEYGYSGIPTEKGAESCDVIARCIALGYVGYELEKRFEELKGSERWACPDCSDQYETPQKLVELEYSDGYFTCPECGCSTCSPEDDACVKIDDMSAYAFRIEDTHEAPQCGAEVKYFETWAAVERYIELNPDVSQRIADGYAAIKEN